MGLSRRDLIRRFGLSTTAVTIPSILRTSLRASDRTSSPIDFEQLSGLLRLDGTGNAYGPSAKAVEAMRQSLDAVSRYPDLESRQLRGQIAAHHGVHEEQVVLACGSSEILRMAAHAFTGPAKPLLTGFPTFEVIGHFAARAGAEVVTIPLTKDYAHDLAATVARARSKSAGLIYICNPNNPTGTVTDRADLDAFLAMLPPTVHVLIDEAYHHYLPPARETESFLDRRAGDDRVIVARTFSKIFGLAGLRVGYAVASSRTASLLDFQQLKANINTVAARAAAAALADVEHVTSSAKHTADDRQEFYNQARTRTLRVIDSRTNFVMVDSGRRASRVVEHFGKHDILLEPPFPPFETFIRVSLGMRSEMREFWRVWDLMPPSAVHNM